MKVRIVVAGSRHYNNYTEAKQFIDEVIQRIGGGKTFIVLSGGCRGADMLGERYANEKGYPIEKHPAQWDKYGRSAGLIRNKVMAEKCDYAICFWDRKSKGTKAMIEYAQKEGKIVETKYI